MTYQVAETFRSVQGEGVHTGTLMQFVRFVGCSVGKTICTHCDTDFKQMYGWKGGGEFSAEGIESMCKGVNDVCLTGGEPFNQELIELLPWLGHLNVHIETSGTVPYDFTPVRNLPGYRTVGDSDQKLWITVSPKPGYMLENVLSADEVKVIVPGLGDGPGWPTLDDALRWAGKGKIVYLQPRNGKNDVNVENLQLVLQLVQENPELRLSPQLHKFIKVR
jgi:7-carboxy-7-deazaguanine synthase